MNERLMLSRIVSGGQTGVDQAALRAAIRLGLDHGGWCPKGRRCEDGVIPREFELQETATSNYQERTERNVVDSDATLIFYYDELSGGTALTRRFARRHGKPHECVDLSQDVPFESLRQWIREHSIDVLNIAGPRASSHDGIEARAQEVVVELLESHVGELS